MNITKTSKIYEKYEIKSKIGGGGMGTVFLVHDKATNEPFALKYRHNDFNETNKKRFRNEKELLKKINSKRIPKLVDEYEDDKEQYYVMEYIEGITLYSKIKDNGQLDTKLAVNFAKQIAEAIGEVHSHGIIHRDIKSQNILVDKSQNIKLIDLGISIGEETQRLTKTNAVICSPYYAAPELSTKNAKITKAVDIYALGVVLYEMLIGNYPFEGERDDQTILMHRNSSFPRPRDHRNIPQALENVVLKATAKNAKDRYKDVWEFINDLKTVFKTERILENPISQKTGKPKKNLPDFINSNVFLIISISVISTLIITIFVLISVL